MEITYLSEQSQLDEFIARLSQNHEEKLVALDTEFERRSTFYPKPALLQIAFENHIYLIDLVTFPRLDALFECLAQKTVVMHACREDLEVFRELSQHRLQKVVDTQVAASLLGYESQLSYQKLVEAITGNVLDKNETCSDWLQRPLSAEQIHYAADDVRFLLNIYQDLFQRLQSAGREQWFWQDMEFILDNLEEPACKDYFFRMKGLGRCSEQVLNAAYDLILWREQLARQKNIPRGFVIKDKGLLQIIKVFGANIPESPKALFKLDYVPAAFVKRYGNQVLSIMSQAEMTTEKQQAIKMVVHQVPIESKAFAKVLKKTRDRLSQELNINPEVLLSNKLLGAVIDAVFVEHKQSCFKQELKPWREALFLESIKGALA